MKKVLVLIFIVLLIPGIRAYATFDPYYPEEVIHVYLYDNAHEYYYYDDVVTGYLDMLVKKDKVGSRMLPEVSELFTTLHPYTTNTDYLNPDAEWISYAAYVENAYVQKDQAQPIAHYTFAYRQDIIHFESIKLVYFDELGNLMSESDEIMITPPSEEEWIEVEIRLNMDTGANELTITKDEYVNFNWGDVVNAIFMFIFRVILIILGIALSLIAIFKIYEVIQKRKDFQ